MSDIQLRPHQPNDTNSIVNWLDHNCTRCSNKPNCDMFKNYEIRAMFGIQYDNVDHLKMMFDNKNCSKFVNKG